MKKNILTILVCSFVLFGCADQLEITPPNKITDEQIMQLLESGNSESIKIVLGSMANELPMNTIFGILRQVPSIKIFLIGIMPGNVFLQPINC